MKARLTWSWFWILAFVLGGLCLTGCSGKKGDVYKYMSADDAVVAIGDLKDMLECTGSTCSSQGIELSDGLSSMLDVPASAKTVKGLDASTMGLVGNNDYMMLVMMLTDKGDFCKWLEQMYPDAKRSSDGGYEVFDLGSRTTVLVKGAMAWAVCSNGSESPVKILEKAETNAASQPLSEWQRAMLDDAEAISILCNVKKIRGSEASMLPILNLPGYDEKALETSWLALDAKIEGATIKYAAKVVDADGKLLTNTLMNSKVDTSLMKYAGKDDTAVLMAAIPQEVDWYTIFDKMFGDNNYGGLKRQIVSVCSVLDNISGSVMVAGGLADMMSMNSLGGWHLVVAAQMVPGKAEEYVGMLQMHCDDYMLPSSIDGTCLRIDIPGLGTVYVASVGDDFVASTAPISQRGGCAISASVFADTYGGMVLNFDKENPLVQMSGLPCGINVQYFATPEQASGEIALVGEKSFVPLFEYLTSHLN